MPKHVILSVTNDLYTDRRVHKTAMAFVEKGYDVLLVGRKRKNSLPLENRPYPTRRMNLFFDHGALFYAEYNIRLFLLLLFRPADILVANDLDTLPACFAVSEIKNKELLYDAHEYFTEVPEVQHRPLVKAAWELFEGLIFPRLRHITTVNDSIAGQYYRRYGKIASVIRNIPYLNGTPNPGSRAELELPADKKIVLYQGAGINIDRGTEEAVEAMKYLDNTLLLIIGDGDVMPELKKRARLPGIEGKVLFIPKLPPEELRLYTLQADIGLTLDKDINLNYKFSLPNKLFDYIHAGIPVLASEVPEVKKIVTEYNVGSFIHSHDPVHIADRIRWMLSDEQQINSWKENARKAARELCWQNEILKLQEVISRIGRP